MLSDFYVCAYIQVYFRLDFTMDTNTMDPDQTAPLMSTCKQQDASDLLCWGY